MKGKAKLFFREPGVAAGLEEASIIFQTLGCTVKCKALDGDKILPNKVLIEVEGTARAILAGERTALNIVSHMSGIATITSRLAEECFKVNPNIRIAATRKTLPGLRELEKKAVVIGGGDPHRIRLDDCLLIKDNHLKLIPSITEAIRIARKYASFTKKIEVETESLEQAIEAAQAGADVIMFDNQTPTEVQSYLEKLAKLGLRNGRIYEASGGITLENALEYAATGVDVISLGALTHSAKSLDVKLEVMYLGRESV